MIGWRWGLASGLAATVAAFLAVASAEETAGVQRLAMPRASDGTLSVMTYNVEGLPWPLRSGRADDLQRIGARLHAMRLAGNNPHVVLLQEAFTADAQAIGRNAGYRYIVSGPAADRTGNQPEDAADRTFLARARWVKGETVGKIFGSGLQILSDYPILSVQRMAYPAFACAGYDCLANKGAMLASIAVPGMVSPVDIVTTHLNSRRASGVQTDRSLFAYQRQTDLLSDFLHKAHDDSRPLIVAGDFNVNDQPRRLALLSRVATRWTAAGPFHDALHQAVAADMPLSSDARFVLNRGRDWQFFAPGTAASLHLRSIDVPFGRAADGTMLSDHIGYSATYEIRPATRTDRSKA